MTRFPIVAEGLEPRANDHEIDVYTADSTDAAALDIRDALDDTRVVLNVLNDAVLVATFNSDGSSISYVPIDGGQAVDVSDGGMGFVAPNPTEDAVLIPGADGFHMVNLASEPEAFEFEADGFDGGVWIDSDTILWVDEAGVVRVGSTDGTTKTVGEVSSPGFTYPRWENGRLLVSVQDFDLAATHYLYSEAEGLVEIGEFSFLRTFDGPGDSTIGVTYDDGPVGGSVGLLNPSTGGLDTFHEGDAYGFSTNGSTFSYSVFGEDFDDFATHVVDLSDLSSIEVEVYEGVAQLSSMPATSRWDRWQGTTQQ